MFPTFDIGDQLLVDKISAKTRPYLRRDVVVFNPPEAYIEMTGNKEALIKRVVAVGGDTVQIKNSKLYINGIEQDEPYTNENPDYELPLIKVPAGYLLVLGDNRNHSFDSHVWGYLPNENVIGRAVFKYWPPLRVGFVEGSM
jgi:signal peptidase I